MSNSIVDFIILKNFSVQDHPKKAKSKLIKQGYKG